MLAALSLEQPAPKTAGSEDIKLIGQFQMCVWVGVAPESAGGSEDIKPIGQIQIRVRIIISTHF